MSKLMVFGLCPLPMENTVKSFGPGIRAWQFIKPLLGDGHEVVLVSFRIPFIYPETTPPEWYTEEYGFPFYAMDQALFENSAHLSKIVKRHQPEAMIAVTIFATRGALQVRKREPLWIDLFGHVMAEAQAKAYRYENDGYLSHFWGYEREAITQGDIFSAVSTPQKFATIGELGALGRLNRLTTGYQFVEVIPCAAEETVYSHDEVVLRGKLLDDNAFVVLWSGGYNTWTDVTTLFHAMELAMTQNDRIYFVSTGGAIDGHDEKTYPAFLELIHGSPYRDRYLLLGWLPKPIVHNYYFEADIGINIDKFMYEGMFGSKNRVLDWARAGLPALVGDLCELSRLLPKERIGWSYPLGDHEALAARILDLAANPEEVKATGTRAREFLLTAYSFGKTTEPVRVWAQQPHNSPDIERSIIQEVQASAQDSGAIKVEQQVAQHKDYLAKLEQYTRHLEREIKLRDAYKVRDHLRLIWRRLWQPPVVRTKPFGALPITPKATVIIVSYNGAAYLEACIKAVVQSSHQNLEMIVVDNASLDNSVQILKKRFPNVNLIINNTNRGFAAANNQGIQASTGDIIIMLNQDTIIEPECIRVMVRALVADPTVGIVGCKIYHEDGKTLQHAGGILHPNALTDHRGAGELDIGQYEQPLDVQYVTGAAIGFRKELCARIGLLDEDYRPAYFEELDFCLRAQSCGYRVRYLPAAKLVHFESTASGKFSDVFFYRYHRNRIRFVIKNLGFRKHIPAFITHEFKWLVRHLPPEQKQPLLAAYKENLRLLPRTLAARLRERKRIMAMRRGK